MQPPPVKGPEGEKSPLPRLAHCFELRARRSAQLKTPHAEAALAKDPNSYADPTVAALEDNENDIQSQLPWRKNSPYYTKEGGPYTTPQGTLDGTTPLSWPPEPPKKPTRTKLKGGFFK